MSLPFVIPPCLVEYTGTFGDWTLTLGYELWENQRSQDAIHGENVTLGITLSHEEACRWRDSVGWSRGFRTLNVLTRMSGGAPAILTIGMVTAPVSVKPKTQVTTTTTLTVA